METETAHIIYEDQKGKKYIKEITIPVVRYGMGITKQREGHVIIGWFDRPPKHLAVIGEHYHEKSVALPKTAVFATARLKIGKRIVSRAK